MEIMAVAIGLLNVPSLWSAALARDQCGAMALPHRGGRFAAAREAKQDSYHACFGRR